MMNYVWLVMLLLGIIVGVVTHKLDGVTEAIFTNARTGDISSAVAFSRQE